VGKEVQKALSSPSPLRTAREKKVSFKNNTFPLIDQASTDGKADGIAIKPTSGD